MKHRNSVRLGEAAMIAPGSQRGVVLVTVALSMGVVLAVSALAVDLGYGWLVKQQLQNAADAGAHAGAMELDGTAAGTSAARAAAVTYGRLNQVLGDNDPITQEDVSLGVFDVATGSFTPSADPARIDAVRINAEVGVGRVAFAKAGFSVDANSSAVRGPGNAGNEADTNGVWHGHFDLDTSTSATKYTVGSASTYKHTHEYDNRSPYLTYGDAFAFSSASGHAKINTTIPAGQRFKLILGNANLSPGVQIFINDTVYDSTTYDDIPIADLPVWSIKAGVGGATQLTKLKTQVDVDAIDNCALIPTITSQVRKNTLGRNGEWRNGALTLQAIRVNAAGQPVTSSGALTTPDLTKSNGGVQGVATSAANGLLWENTYFWHWDQSSYDQFSWQEEFDALTCSTIWIEP